MSNQTSAAGRIDTSPRSDQQTFHPASLAELAAFAVQHPRIQITGSGTKPALYSTLPGVVKCKMTRLAGIVEHQPAEFLITAWSGTPLTELQETLARHGQYLPFDPPFSRQGATIGGTVAVGLSGAGRLRFGGLRDFIVGIQLVDGEGHVIRGGGRVVKNAAGYDIPKLMVGSAGLLGIITEVTLKVFPRPTHHLTIRLDADTFPNALALQSRLSRAGIDLAAIDLEPTGTLFLRVEGPQQAVQTTFSRIESLLKQSDTPVRTHTLNDDAEVWAALDTGSFATEQERLVRVPVYPSRLPEIDSELEMLRLKRRYSVAGNLLWVAWPNSRPIQQLDECLRHLHLGGTVLRGDVPHCRLGVRPNESMWTRVKQSLDPQRRFVGNGHP